MRLDAASSLERRLLGALGPGRRHRNNDVNDLRDEAGLDLGDCDDGGEGRGDLCLDELCLATAAFELGGWLVVTVVIVALARARIGAAALGVANDAGTRVRREGGREQPQHGENGEQPAEQHDPGI